MEITVGLPCAPSKLESTKTIMVQFIYMRSDGGYSSLSQKIYATHIEKSKIADNLLQVTNYKGETLDINPNFIFDVVPKMLVISTYSQTPKKYDKRKEIKQTLCFPVGTEVKRVSEYEKIDDKYIVR